MLGFLNSIKKSIGLYFDAPNRTKGQEGEIRACHYLKSKGYRHIESNFRGSRGEIDLIMSIDGALVFVEVKARKSPRVRPMAAVNSKKQKRIVKTAMEYVRQLKNPRQRIRFDVVEVYLNEDDPYRIHHIPGAFEGAPKIDYG